MKHFVSYHNADKIGYAFEDAIPFSVGTTKSVDRLVGQHVWSISGDGQPRTYSLRDTYIVDSVGPSAQSEFTSLRRGSTGVAFNPPVVLNHLPWFRAFLKSQSNFSLGLQQIKEEFVVHLEALAPGLTATNPPIAYPDEVDLGVTYREGAVMRVAVNAYERNPAARRRCVEHYGAKCSICGFNFGKAYGPTVEGLIHVHHVRPLSEVSVDHEVDPIADLRPVCPNCHAVLHSRKPAYGIEEVVEFLRRHEGS